MKITFYQGTDKERTIETKYDIGDTVIVRSGFYYPGDEPMPEMAKFYTDEKDSDGYNKTEVQLLPWTVTDIRLSVGSDSVTYELRYRWRRSMFPYSGKCVGEREIIRKLTKEELDELLPKID
jgi:hypothetical protein